MAIRYTKEDISPFWNNVIADIKDSLMKSYPDFSSGATAGLIEAPVITVGENSYNVKLIMPDYYLFMDEGVRGQGGWVNPMTSTGKVKSMKRNTGRFFFKDKGKGAGGRGQKGIPNIGSMRTFMINRGIVGKTAKGSRGTKNAQKQLDSIAAAIALSIWQQGLEQTDFYSNVVNDKLIEDYADMIAEELGQKILVTLVDGL